MGFLYYKGPNGELVEVSGDNPLPVTGGGGAGGMTPDDISADAPATWDAETATIGVAVGTSAGTVAAGNHTHAGLMSGSAPAVPDSEAEDVETLVGDLNALLSALRARGVIA